jgi:hypothetical protein
MKHYGDITQAGTVTGTLMQTNELEILTGAIDFSKAGLGTSTQPYVGAAGVNLILNAGPVGSEVRLQTGGGTANVRAGNGTPTLAAAGGYISAETVSGTNARIGDTVSSQTLSASRALTVSGVPVVAGVIQTGGLANQAATQVDVGSLGSSGSLTTTYADLTSLTVTTRAGEKVVILASSLVAPGSGSTVTVTIRRGTTVVGPEPGFIVFSNAVVFAEDTPGAGTFTYNISAKDNNNLSTWNTAQICLVGAK